MFQLSGGQIMCVCGYVYVVGRCLLWPGQSDGARPCDLSSQTPCFFFFSSAFAGGKQEACSDCIAVTE